MSSNITKEQINTTMALALMKHLFNQGKISEKVYKKIGMSYIQFAKDFPEFFKILFMQQTNQKVEYFMRTDTMYDQIIQAGQKMTHLSYEEQEKFHIKVWIFTHGIACLVATNTVQLSEQEIADLLGTTVMEMMLGRK